MMVAIQILAGAMSQIEKGNTIYGIELFFHGVSSRLVSHINQDIVSRLQQGQTPSDLLNYFLSLQSEDPSSWAPKQCR
jgi:hypothetical protein